MKTVGIICEYNPFHLGHLRQYRLIKQQLGEDTAIVCVMSGNFVQRGAPAKWDKFTRAAAAVACGADLVLELPITKVLQSAEGFARGGVDILTRLGFVDHLCFGAETADINELLSVAARLNDTNDAFREALSAGMPYAAAKQLSAADTNGTLSTPNNILAVEYCRALLHSNSPITPLAVQRNGDYHASAPDQDEPSATAVRALFPDGNWQAFVPQESAAHLKDAPTFEIHCGERAVLSRLRAMSDEEWQRCAHGSEGLWSKAMKASRSECSLDAIIDATKSKRYPRTRIQRLLLCAYLGITAKDLLQPVSYVRILSASELGRKLIRQAKNDASIPIINPGETPKDTVYYRTEVRSSDLFTLFSTDDVPLCQTEQNSRLKL